ncbi:hypothetical protein QR685DRAFT_534207 [Neurospora intermedia]|uniref:Uncharacterized protein n=1 Tax=Neurospora intermedia TaxID=5142 RepID=A0ABR3D3X6_NEUIN
MAGDGEFERVPRPDNYPHGPEFQPRTLHQRLQGKWWYRVPPNHSKPIYQFLSIGLGASMWFWVNLLVITNPAYPGQVTDSCSPYAFTRLCTGQRRTGPFSSA